MFYIYKETNNGGDEFDILFGTDLEQLRNSAYAAAERHTKSERNSETYSIWGYDVASQEEYNELLENSFDYPDPDFYEVIAIGTFEVETSVAVWTDGSGFESESVVDSRKQDISSIDAIDPARWWVEYCDYRRTVTGDGRDCKVIVRVYAPDSWTHEALYEVSAWESEMYGWEE